jgi:predicted transcriptional regulator of viral defense system
VTVSRLPDSSRLAGVITIAELTAAGISKDQVQRLVQRGILRRVVRGGYAPAELAAAQSGDYASAHAVLVTAALAVTGPGAVASHRSAALVHGLYLLGRETGQRISLTRPPQAGRKSGRPGVHLHAAALPAGHVVSVKGMPVTSVARTVIDLARMSSFVAGVVVADSALRSGQTSKEELQSVISDCARWRGIQTARRVVAFSDGRSESVLESISRVAFRDHGLPPPDLQIWVGDAIEMIGRADFLWRAYRTIAEADGAVKYADPARAIDQLNRDTRLRDADFEVVHFTWPEITRSPSYVVASIHAAFRRSAARQP